MSWKFQKIEKDEEGIKGQPKNSSPITVPDEGWIDTKDDSENDSDPKWREISRLLTDTAFVSDEDIQSESDVKIDINTAVEALSESDYINHADNDTEQENLMSRLLIEYLVSEGIYELDQHKLVILKDPTVNEGQTRTNYRGWHIFMKAAAENRDSIVDEIKKEKKKLKQEMENLNIGEDLKEEYDNLVRDLVQISDKDLSKSSVSDEDLEEYNNKMIQVETLYPAIKDRGERLDIEGVISEIIAQMNMDAKIFRDRATIYGMKNISEAIKELERQYQIDGPIDVDPNLTAEGFSELGDQEKAKEIVALADINVNELATPSNNTEYHDTSNQRQSDQNSIDEDFVE